MRVVPTYSIVILIVTAAVLLWKSVAGFQPVVQEPVVYAETNASRASNACRFPTRLSASPEQTAWQIFVAATCPVGATHAPYVVWESWTEQQPARFASSPLVTAAGSNEQDASSPAPTPFSGCRSLRSGRTICEEVRSNPGMLQWPPSPNGIPLPLRAGAYGNPDLSPPSVVIKAHWLRLASCAGTSQAVHVERTGSNCYELGGIQLISELGNHWLSAHFEVQDVASNPARCRIDGCRDPWGSVPSFSWGGAGGNTRISSELSSLMQDADLGSEWRNYRLGETDLGLIDSQGNPLPPEKPEERTQLSAEKTKRGRGKIVGQIENFSPASESSIPGPVALPEDKWSFRDSASVANTGCPGEDFSRTCSDEPVAKKTKPRRKT